MARPVLITGFGNFGIYRPNPSFAALSEAKQRQLLPPNVVIGEIRTEWANAHRDLQRLVEQHRPRGILCTGVSGDVGPQLRAELFGFNRQNTSYPDADGVIAQGPHIDPNGPNCSVTDLDYTPLRSLFKGTNILMRDSVDPGDYLCNFLIYKAALYAQSEGIPFGFLHVPLVRELLLNSDEVQKIILNIHKKRTGNDNLTIEQLMANNRTLTLAELAQVESQIACTYATHCS